MDPERRGALLLEWARREQAAEREATRQESPEDRVELALELSQLARGIGIAACATWLEPGNDLEEKARRLAYPRPQSARRGR